MVHRAVHGRLHNPPPILSERCLQYTEYQRDTKRLIFKRRKILGGKNPVIIHRKIYRHKRKYKYSKNVNDNLLYSVGNILKIY